MGYQRQVEKNIKKHFDVYQQTLCLLGPRQVGKTTLLKRLFPDAQYFLLDNLPLRKQFETYDINVYNQFIDKNKIIIIDEVHLLSNPGQAIKIIYDQIPDIKMVFTGSSALNIRNKMSESLAGRKIDYYLYPLTYFEYLVQNGIEKNINSNILDNIINNTLTSEIKTYDKEAVLRNVLIYGLYPLTMQKDGRKEYLRNLADSIIFKDIVELNLLENKTLAKELLQVLAHQIGNMINYTELARKLKADITTIQRYIEIFEQSFIIFRLYPFSRNKRDEIGRAPKIFFYDIGLRNALISNFEPVYLRQDFGAIFENFIISEVWKLNRYCKTDYNLNYWRVKHNYEVDLIISGVKKFIGCEIKVSKGRVTSAFTNRYPEAETRLLSQENFY